MKLHDVERKFKDSGVFTVKNETTLVAQGQYVFPLDDRFSPYDDLLITNLNSDSDCTITINNRHTTPLAKGTTVTIDNENVRDVRIKNDGSDTIAINELIVQYRHTGKEGRSKVKLASEIASIGSLVKGFF